MFSCDLTCSLWVGLCASPIIESMFLSVQRNDAFLGRQHLDYTYIFEGVVLLNEWFCVANSFCP